MTLARAGMCRQCCDEEFADDGDDDDYFDREDFDEMEEAIANCGQLPGLGCLKAGSEECDFDCPFRDEDIFADPDDDD